MLQMRSFVAVFFWATRNHTCFKIWHSAVRIDPDARMVPGGPRNQGTRVQKVQGSRVRRVQRSKRPQERIQGSWVKHSAKGAGLCARPHEPREKPSGRAKGNKDGKAGEGPW